MKICERRRSTINSGGICHTSRRVNLTHDHLSILLIAINCLFLIMTGPFNVSLIVQSIGRFCSVNPVSPLVTSRINEHLRVLQNSYHALSFVFYCVIGNKFRDSACSVCGRNQHTLPPLAHDRSQSKSSSILCCAKQKDSFKTTRTFVTTTHSKHTLATTSMQFSHPQKHSPILLKSMQHLNTALWVTKTEFIEWINDRPLRSFVSQRVLLDCSLLVPLDNISRVEYLWYLSTNDEVRVSVDITLSLLFPYRFR